MSASDFGVSSRLQPDFALIQDKSIKYSGERPKTAESVFKLALRIWRILDEELEILASVDRLHSTIELSEAQIQSP